MRTSSYLEKGLWGIAIAGGLYLTVMTNHLAQRSSPTPSTTGTQQSIPLEVAADTYQPPLEQKKTLEALCKLGYDWFPNQSQENKCAPGIKKGDDRYAGALETFCGAMKTWETAVGDRRPGSESFLQVRTQAADYGIKCDSREMSFP